MAACNIYDFIRSIQRRPGMYSPDKSLRDIETYLFGYEACLSTNNIVEDISGRRFTLNEFNRWLYDTYGWSGGLGIAHAIAEHTSGRDEAFERFFELVEQYRVGEAEKA